MPLFRNPLTLSAACLSLTLLAGCERGIAPIVDLTPALPEKFCKAVPQISTRKADVITDETAQSIEKANKGREAVGCPYEPPPKSAPAKTS